MAPAEILSISAPIFYRPYYFVIKMTRKKPQQEPDIEPVYDDDEDIYMDPDVEPEEYTDDADQLDDPNTEQDPSNFAFAEEAGDDFDNELELELSSEELMQAQKFIDSDIGKSILHRIKTAPLSIGCKKAFESIVRVYFSKDVFLSFVTKHDICKLNLALELEHVILHSSADDIARPEYLQIKTEILEPWGFIISRTGKERILQGMKRIEQRTGAADTIFPQVKIPEQKTKKSFFNFRK